MHAISLSSCQYHGKVHTNQKVTLVSPPKKGAKGWFVTVNGEGSKSLPRRVVRVLISEQEAKRISQIVDNHSTDTDTRKNNSNHPRDEVHVSIENLSEENLLERSRDIYRRFNLLSKMSKGCKGGFVHSLIVSGTPGVGKSYTVTRALNSLGMIEDVDYTVIRGYVTPINLYITLYSYKEKGKVVIIDDADSILFDETGLNLLKNALDTNGTRKISWLSDALDRKDLDVPKTFIFEGSVVFLSNINFQRIIEEGKHKIAPHLSALMSRSLYLDLNVWSRVDMLAWIAHLIKSGEKIFGENVSEKETMELFNFCRENLSRFRTFSVREIRKLSSLYLSDREEWKENAKVLLFK